ncbi:MAG: serine/threonine-protein kinase, partial [Planctomycetota bacterium]
MDPARFKRIKDLFQSALEEDVAERPAFLDQACQEDQELRREVERLLAVDGDLESSLVTPVTTGLSPGWAQTPLTGMRIGNYRLGRVLSSGGMGTVYEALQDNPRRTVAIKVMKQGVVSRAALRRFEYEAQIMANLTHPHIAQVIEASTHGKAEAEGVPYLVMELVADAQPITDYARRRALSLRERLSLFLQVCDAVHHGHLKGVIHRDLKPGNILVDSRGQVKIIDFGVARATDSDVARTTMQTEVGQILGTLQYMSPEQCEADPRQLDLRSDIYSLGVVLYELICNSLPYDVKKMSMLEATRCIREAPPKPPSASDPSLKGDVEIVLLKALEKEQQHRYQSAADLGSDIRRHLAGEIILARPAGPLIRFRKFARRNPVYTATGGAVLVCFVAFLFYLTLYSYPRLKEEKVKLEEEVENTRRVNEFLQETLSFTDPLEEGREITMSELVDRAAEQVGIQFSGRPEIEAMLRQTLGINYHNSGRYGDAACQLEQALDLLTRLHGEDHPKTLIVLDDLARIYSSQGRYEEADFLLGRFFANGARILGEDHPRIFSALACRALVRMEQGKYEESERLYREALDGHEKLGEVYAPDKLHTMADMAVLFDQQSRFDEAERLHLAVLEGWEKIKGENHPLTFQARNDLASSYMKQSRFSEAEPLFNQVLEGYRRTFGKDYHGILNVLGNIGSCYSEQGKYAEAELVLREALDGKLRSLGGDHPDTLNGMRCLAKVLGWLGRFEEAETLLQEVLEKNMRVLGKEHLGTLNTMDDLAGIYLNHG